MFNFVDFHIELTSQCNHKCFYCYKDQLNNNQVGLSVQSFDVIYKKIAAMGAKRVAIELTGGEPLLNIETIKYAVKLHSNNPSNISMRINTNLTAVSIEQLEELRQTGNHYNLNISIPSLNKEIYEQTVAANTFDKFMTNLKYVIKHKESFSVSANIVLTNINKHDVINTIKKLIIYDVYNCKIGTLHLYDDYSPSQEEIVDIYTKFYQLQSTFPKLNINNNNCYPICIFPNCKQEEIHFVCPSGNTMFVIDSQGFVKSQSRLQPKGNLITEDMQIIMQRFSPIMNSGIFNVCCNCPMYKKQACIGACSKYIGMNGWIKSHSGLYEVLNKQEGCKASENKSWDDLYQENVEMPLWAKTNVPEDIFKKYIPDNTSTILDIGCGNGRIYKPFMNDNVKYVGIDISETAINYCKKKYPNAQFEVANFFDIDIKADVIIDSTFFHIIEPNKRQEYLNVIKRCLNKDGRLLLVSFYSDNSEVPCLKIEDTNIYEWGIDDKEVKNLFSDFTLIDKKEFKLKYAPNINLYCLQING
jgi:MoaA/NifB/PqqE/SkfB family radical SAM enzyme/SAM-dependent methyltransferase